MFECLSTPSGTLYQHLIPSLMHFVLTNMISSVLHKMLTMCVFNPVGVWVTWLWHQMEIFSALLAINAGNSPMTGEFPTQRPVARSFVISFDLRLNKRLSKQLWGWWFETPSRHYNESCIPWPCSVQKWSPSLGESNPSSAHSRRNWYDLTAHITPSEEE